MIQKQRAQRADTGMSDMDQMDAREYRRTLAEVKEQIEYDALDTPHYHERLDEIVEIMTETLCSRKPYRRCICGILHEHCVIDPMISRAASRSYLLSRQLQKHRKKAPISERLRKLHSFASEYILS